MKKTMMMLLSVLTCLLMLTACGAAEPPAASRDYTTLHEQSELRWYLSQNYGKDAVSKYCFYDLNDHGETAFTIAQRYLDGQEPQLLMLVFDMGIDDWFCYGNDLYVSRESEQYREIPDVGIIFRLKLVPVSSSDIQYSYGELYPIDVYATYNKDGLLERIYVPYGETLESGTAGIYEYDRNGAVSTYAGVGWGIGFEDAFSSEFKENPEYLLTYSYGDNGFLKEAFDNAVGSGNMRDRYDFSYSAIGRTSVKRYDPETGETEETLETKRDADGRLVSAQSYSVREDYEKNFTFSYQPDGLCVYRWE